MAIGYILINTAPTHEHEVYTKLSKVSEIVEVHSLFGEFDLIVKVEPEDFDKIGELVVKKIRSIKGVIGTKTLPAYKYLNK